MHRLLKQSLYGIFYLIIFGFLFVGAFLYFKGCNGESCVVVCETCNLKIFYTDPKALFVAEDTTTLLVQINNPNKDFGLAEFDYTFRVFSRFGPELIQIGGVSSLYPGEKKYIFQSRLNLNASDVGSVNLEFGRLDWKRKEELPARPAVAISGIKISEDISAKIAEGVVEVNKDTAELRLVAIGFDEGIISRASIATLSNLRANSPETFKIFLPNIDYSKVDVFYDILPE